MLMGIRDAMDSGGSVDDTLAVVNRGGAYFDTGFVLGDYMTMEVCFLVPDEAVLTGNVLVGHMGGENDGRDFRLFFANFNGGSVYLDAGWGRSAAPISRDEWHTVLGPADGNLVVDGSVVVWSDAYAADGGYGVNGMSMGVFSKSSTSSSQVAAIRYITVTRYGTSEILCDLWPDRRGGFFDKVSRRLILPSAGSVDVVDWRSL